MQHKFVEFIPEVIESDIVYVTMQYKTAVHLCVCGCGNKVVTPITPTDWKITFDGKTISLSPSIGNWNFECQSHYWIKNNKIEFARKWNSDEVEWGRQADRKKKKNYFKEQKIKMSLFYECVNLGYSNT